MADLFLNSVDGSDADSGATWALAKATLATGIAAIDTTDQRVVIDSAHAETAASISYTAPGTPAAPNQLLSVTQTGTDQISALTAGATFTANSGSTGITFNGSLYAYGLTLTLSSSSASALTLGNGSGNVQVWDTCTLNLTSTSSSSYMAPGVTATGGGGRVTFVGCTFRFGATGQRIYYTSDVMIRGGSWSASGTLNPTAIFAPNLSTRGARLQVDGFDFSNLNAAVNLHGSGQGGAIACFRSCKLPASWTGAPIADASLVPGQRVEMYNCDSGDTNYRLWIKEYGGSIREDTGVYHDAGATDGTTRLSWKMATTANVKYPSAPLASPEIMRWNETTGSALTVTVEIVHASQGSGTAGALTDDEIWLEVQYLGTSGVPLSSFITDAKASVIATAADQATSSATWTGDSAGWDTQALSVSLTPQEKGWLVARVLLAKPSATVYVDPLLTVA